MSLSCITFGETRRLEKMHKEELLQLCRDYKIKNVCSDLTKSQLVEHLILNAKFVKDFKKL